MQSLFKKLTIIVTEKYATLSPNVYKEIKSKIQTGWLFGLVYT